MIHVRQECAGRVEHEIFTSHWVVCRTGTRIHLISKSIFVDDGFDLVTNEFVTILDGLHYLVTVPMTT